MKNRPSLNCLLKHFLKTSPRARTIFRNGILPPEHHLPLNKLPTDQQFIKNFIVHLDISYMYQYYGPLTVNQHKAFLHKKSFFNPLSQGLLRKNTFEIHSKQHQKRVILQQLIKQLNKDKYIENKYIQCQQFIYGLNNRQIRENKKLIVLLYKWALNQKYKFKSGSIYQQLCHQLCEVIVKKIYEAHAQDNMNNNNNKNKLNNQQNISTQQQSNSLTTTKQQLILIQTLQNARQSMKLHNYHLALSQYSIIYWSQECQQMDRGQALNSICEICQKQNNIMIKQKNGPIIGHLKYLEKMLMKIKDKMVKGKKQSKENNINKSNNKNENENQHQEEFFTVNNISLQSKTTISQSQSQSKQHSRQQQQHQSLQQSQQQQKKLQTSSKEQIIPSLTTQQPPKILLTSPTQQTTQKPSTHSPQKQLQSMIPPTNNNGNNIQ